MVGRVKENAPLFNTCSVDASENPDGRETVPSGDEGRRWPDLGDVLCGDSVLPSGLHTGASVDGEEGGALHLDSDLAGLSIFDLHAVADDLIRGERELSAEESLALQLPPEPPGVPTLYPDAQTSKEIGYHDKPRHERVIPLCKKKYSQEQAIARFAELQEQQGLVVLDAFYTARHFCWRVLVTR